MGKCAHANTTGKRGRSAPTESGDHEREGVVISLLNAYAGLAAYVTGFALDSEILILCGALDGSSGLLLPLLMSRTMN